MDPVSCLKQAAEMIADGDIDGAVERLDAHSNWVRQGGFQTDSDARNARKLRAKVRQMIRQPK